MIKPQQHQTELKQPSGIKTQYSQAMRMPPMPVKPSLSFAMPRKRTIMEQKMRTIRTHPANITYALVVYHTDQVPYSPLLGIGIGGIVTVELSVTKTPLMRVVLLVRSVNS